jgi:hypothetical protein
MSKKLDLQRLLHKRPRSAVPQLKVKPPNNSLYVAENPFKVSQEKENNFKQNSSFSFDNSNLEFAVPRLPSAKKESLLESSLQKENSKEMVMNDNFSFKEAMTRNSLKKVKLAKEENSSTVLGSICSSIINRYNSFLKVVLIRNWEVVAATNNNIGSL